MYIRALCVWERKKRKANKHIYTFVWRGDTNTMFTCIGRFHFLSISASLFACVRKLTLMILSMRCVALHWCRIFFLDEVTHIRRKEERPQGLQEWSERENSKRRMKKEKNIAVIMRWLGERGLHFFWAEEEGKNAAASKFKNQKDRQDKIPRSKIT